MINGRVDGLVKVGCDESLCKTKSEGTSMRYPMPHT
jgi:hypothetical protein